MRVCCLCQGSEGGYANEIQKLLKKKICSAVHGRIVGLLVLPLSFSNINLLNQVSDKNWNANSSKLVFLG